MWNDAVWKLALGLGMGLSLAHAQGIPLIDEALRQRAFKIRELNGRLLINSPEEAERYTPAYRDKLTTELRQLLQEEIIASLSESNGDPDAVRHRLQLLDPAPRSERTKAPYVLRASLSGVPWVLTGLLILRGGSGAYDTKVLLEAYRKAGARWEFASATGDDLDGFGLFLKEVKSPRTNEIWLLAYGVKTGSNNRSTRLRMYVFDGEEFRTAWAPPDLLQAEVSVRGETFSVHHLDRRQYYELRQAPVYRLDEYVLTYFGVQQISSLLVPE